MTVIAWEHLVRDVMPRLEAELLLREATAASVPHMTEDSRREALSHWQAQVMTVARGVAALAKNQASTFRRWLSDWGLDPETGQERRRRR